MNKKIAIIGTVGLPAIYGGFETLAEYLTKHLSDEFQFTVYCSGKSYTHQPTQYNQSQLVYLPFNANGIQSIPYDIFAMLDALRYADVLLVLGVSGCLFLPVIRLISRKKIIVNIDGLEWKRHKWGRFAKCFLKFSEKLAVRYAHTVVADNQVIQNYVTHEYKVLSELIAYGGDHAFPATLSDDVLQRYPFLSENYAFMVCRIEPENNIHVILEAGAGQGRLPLVLVGNWQASAYGAQLYGKYSKITHIHLLEPIYDQAVLNQIRSNCLVYLHGHSAGGTNPSLVEAMNLGLPVIAYAADYNKQSTENAALYFSDAAGLKQLLMATDHHTLQRISENMLEIAKRRYMWHMIAKHYAGLMRDRVMPQSF